MIWAATQGAPFQLRDGRGFEAPMRTVGIAPVPFSNLDEAELRRLGGPQIVVLTTAAEARAFEKKAKDAKPNGAAMVRIKTGAHNAGIIAGRKGVEPGPVMDLVREALTKDTQVTWQQATEAALERVAKAGEEARAKKKAAALPPPPKRRPSRPVEDEPSDVDQDDDDEPDEDEGQGDAS